MKKHRILVFDQDHSLRELLRTYLGGQGYEVLAFSDPTICPLYHKLLDEKCRCPKNRPCADSMLVDIKMKEINAFDFLKLQRQRGCKALDANKAVMSASMTQKLEAALVSSRPGSRRSRRPSRRTGSLPRLPTAEPKYRPGGGPFALGRGTDRPRFFRGWP